MVWTPGRTERAFTLVALGLALTLASCLRANPDFVPEDEPGAPDAGSVAAPDAGSVVTPDVGSVAAPDRAPFADGSPLAPDLGPAQPAPELGPAPDLVPPDTGPICATGEEAFAGHCYRVLQGSLMTYPEARQLCKAEGALPVSIGSAAEAAAVFALVPKNLQAVWIGLLRNGDGKKSFVWESGEPFGYTSWAPGEPNNSGYQEDCVVLWGPAITMPSLAGSWNDAACWSPRGAVVCERTP
jgi:hypothetical protein